MKRSRVIVVGVLAVASAGLLTGAADASDQAKSPGARPAGCAKALTKKQAATLKEAKLLAAKPVPKRFAVKTGRDGAHITVFGPKAGRPGPGVKAVGPTDHVGHGTGSGPVIICRKG